MGRHKGKYKMEKSFSLPSEKVLKSASSALWDDPVLDISGWRFVLHFRVFRYPAIQLLVLPQ